MRNWTLLLALLSAAAILSGCPNKEEPAETPQASNPPAHNTESAPPATDEASLVARGQAIYSGTEYSNTGLSCAHCHAASPDEESGHIFIAHSGYGAYTRGAWKITSAEQLAAKKGFAATLTDAANACVGAPYMNHKEKLISGDDAAALDAYFKSISKTDGKDSQAFIIAKAKDLPAPGLKPDKAHGRTVYESSCKFCHEAGIEGLEGIKDAKDWLTPVQVMAKVRKLDGWYDNYKDKKYALAVPANEGNARLLAVLGIKTARAEGAEANPCNPCAANPCNPCGSTEDGAGSQKGEGEESEEHEVFAENAMPFFGTDILSDQDVVDVSFFLIEGE